MSSFDDIIARRSHSERDGTPLHTCSMCEAELDSMDYFTIAKAFSNGRIALETVQCFSCQLASKDYASELSIENVMLYSGRRFNEFLQDSIQRKLYHLEDPSCLITGEELTTGDTFELYTFNVPGAGLADNNYVLVGPTAVEQMGDLLSPETKDSWGRYTEQFTPDVPDLIVSPMFL